MRISVSRDTEFGDQVAQHSQTAEDVEAKSIQVADFQLTKNEQGGWRLRILTTRGIHWIQANYLEWDEEKPVLSLGAANAFLRLARKNELRTEYIGPVSRSVF